MAYLKKRERTDTLDKAFKFDDEESVERYLIKMPKKQYFQVQPVKILPPILSKTHNRELVLVIVHMLLKKYNILLDLCISIVN